MPLARPFMLKLLRLAAAAGLCVFLISTALPWLAEQGWAGKAIQETHRRGRDATGLFYTDSQRTREILRQTRTPSQHRDTLTHPSLR